MYDHNQRLVLRDRINDLRRPFVSQYLLDEAVHARKAEVAAAVQRAGGALPQGLDAGLLVSHAAARGQTLGDAVHEVLQESRELRDALALTEQMKDATMSRIAGVATLADIREVGRTIERLGLAAEAGQSKLAKVAA